VNGVRLLTDGSFPFEARFLAPVRTSTATGFVVQAAPLTPAGIRRLAEITVELVPDAPSARPARHRLPRRAHRPGHVDPGISPSRSTADAGGASVRLVNWV